jgi:hypothetical protein
MQSHRIISGLLVLAMVVVVAAGWFLFAQPQVAAAQAGAGQVDAAQALVASSQAKIASLRADSGKLPELQAKLATLESSIPSDIDSAPFIRQLAAQAAQYGVVVTAVSMSDPVYYAAPTGAGTSAPAASPSASATPAPSASAAPATPTGWTAPTDSAISAANFVTIPAIVTFTGTWGQTLAFLQGLQSGTRLYLVDKVSASAAADDGTVEITSTGLLYATTSATSSKPITGLDPKAKATPSATPTPSPTTAAPKPAATSAATTSSPAPSASATASGK